MDFDISRNREAEIAGSERGHAHARGNGLEEALPGAAWPLLAGEDSLVGSVLFGVVSELLGLEWKNWPPAPKPEFPLRHPRRAWG